MVAFCTKCKTQEDNVKAYSTPVIIEDGEESDHLPNQTPKVQDSEGDNLDDAMTQEDRNRPIAIEFDTDQDVTIVDDQEDQEVPLKAEVASLIGSPKSSQDDTDVQDGHPAKETSNVSRPTNVSSVPVWQGNTTAMEDKAQLRCHQESYHSRGVRLNRSIRITNCGVDCSIAWDTNKKEVYSSYGIH